MIMFRSSASNVPVVAEGPSEESIDDPSSIDRLVTENEGLSSKTPRGNYYYYLLIVKHLTWTIFVLHAPAKRRRLSSNNQPDDAENVNDPLSNFVQLLLQRETRRAARELPPLPALGEIDTTLRVISMRIHQLLPETQLRILRDMLDTTSMELEKQLRST